MSTSRANWRRHSCTAHPKVLPFTLQPPHSNECCRHHRTYISLDACDYWPAVDNFKLRLSTPKYSGQCYSSCDVSAAQHARMCPAETPPPTGPRQPCARHHPSPHWVHLCKHSWCQTTQWSRPSFSWPQLPGPNELEKIGHLSERRDGDVDGAAKPQWQNRLMLQCTLTTQGTSAERQVQPAASIGAKISSIHHSTVNEAQDNTCSPGAAFLMRHYAHSPAST